MLSRTAASLYWLGRYAERADFSARLIEATVRLDALSTRPAGSAAWASALNVIDAGEAFAALGKHVEQRHVAPFLLCSP
ncbi:MAG: alpha-E domain-containing protein, partial [Alphaproteobacteria bacterium]|nr:alpha-E domain-containing protein [Alphaproteobacteria bacterium]